MLLSARRALIALSAVSAFAMLYVGAYQIRAIEQMSCPLLKHGCEAGADAAFARPFGIPDGFHRGGDVRPAGLIGCSRISDDMGPVCDSDAGDFVGPGQCLGCVRYGAPRCASFVNHGALAGAVVDGTPGIGFFGLAVAHPRI